MIKLFDRCPACGGTITITECRCDNCHLEMRGEFRPAAFGTLSDDHAAFVRVFLRARGNLTEVEKVLGISYPTIRNKLDDVNRALDEAGEPEHRPARPAAPAPPVPPVPPAQAASPTQAERRAILQQVAAGEITAVDALQKLRDMQGGQ